MKKETPHTVSKKATNQSRSPPELTKLPTDLSLERLLTEQEAAAFLSVKPKLLSQWRWRGSPVPFAKLNNGLVRYRLKDLILFAEASLRHNTTKE